MSQPHRIATTSTDNLRVLGTVGQRAIELIAGILRRRLSDDHADLFAEPVLSDQGDQADWYTAKPGRAVPFVDLPEDEKLALENLLARFLDDITALADDMQGTDDPDQQRIAEALKNAVQFPGPQSVYGLTGPDGIKPVIVDWASQTEGRNGPGTGTLVAWTPRRTPTTPPQAQMAAPIATSITLADRSAPPRSMAWLVWLLSLLIGGLTAGILFLLLPACGLQSLIWADFCPREDSLAQQIQADEIDRVSRERSVLENKIAFLERDIHAAQNGCLNAVPTPEPDQNEIDERLDREDAQLGDLNFALVWDDQADLDLHITCPGGEIIYFGSRTSAICGGELDVDMNARGIRSADPIEHIFFNNPPPGTYNIKVHFYDSVSRGGSHDFVVRVTFADQTREFRGTVSQQNPRWTESFEYDE